MYMYPTLNITIGWHICNQKKQTQNHESISNHWNLFRISVSDMIFQIQTSIMKHILHYLLKNNHFSQEKNTLFSTYPPKYEQMSPKKGPFEKDMPSSNYWGVETCWIRKKHRTQPNLLLFRMVSFFPPETNIAPCPQAFPKGNSSSNPRDFFKVLQYLGFRQRYSFVFRRV